LLLNLCCKATKKPAIRVSFLILIESLKVSNNKNHKTEMDMPQDFDIFQAIQEKTLKGKPVIDIMAGDKPIVRMGLFEEKKTGDLAIFVVNKNLTAKDGFEAIHGQDVVNNAVFLGLSELMCKAAERGNEKPNIVMREREALQYDNPLLRQWLYRECGWTPGANKGTKNKLHVYKY
jgi:hypothetical protein